MSSPLCVLVLQLQSMNKEKKKALDAYNVDIKKLEAEIVEVALQERTGQSSMFFDNGKTEINPADRIS